MGTAGGTPPHSCLKLAPVGSARAAALLCSHRWPTRQESLSCRDQPRLTTEKTAAEAGCTCQDHLPGPLLNIHPAARAVRSSLRKPALAILARTAESGEALVIQHHQPLHEVL